jgi:hypothetical protein
MENLSGGENQKELSIEEKWEIIKRTGCSDIQEAIRGRSPNDFDPEAIDFMYGFVTSSPSYTQAAPKSGGSEESDSSSNHPA